MGSRMALQLEKETDLEEEKDVFYCREMKMGSRMALYGSREGDRSRGEEKDVFY